MRPYLRLASAVRQPQGVPVQVLLISAFIHPKKKKKKIMNEYTDMPVLAPLHAAARRLSLNPAQEERWDGRKPRCPCATQATSAACCGNKGYCVLCGAVHGRGSLPSASQCLCSSLSHLPFQGMLWEWELVPLQPHERGRRFASALMASNEITMAHVGDKFPSGFRPGFWLLRGE